MSIIVAGRFESMSDAERAARELHKHGFSVWDVSVFSVGGGEGQSSSRVPGVLLAARADDGRLQIAAGLLQSAGAQDIERAEGRWEGGRWADFDPQRAPTRMAHGAESGPSSEQGAASQTEVRQPGAAQPGEEVGDAAFVPTGNEDPGSEIDQSLEAENGRRNPSSMLDPAGRMGARSGASQANPQQGDPEIEAQVRRRMEASMDGDISRGDRARADAQASGEPRARTAPAQQSDSAGQQPQPVGQQQNKQGPAGASEDGKADSPQDAGASGQEAGTGKNELSRGEAWEQAESRRKPGDPPAPDVPLNRNNTTTPEPEGPNDTPRQMRRGEFPPGVGEGELNDPGSTTPGSPKVENRS
ncbi:hypothetical protein [Paracidovorax citrulli]